MGVELKLARGGGRIIWSCACKSPAKIIPPPERFPPLGILFHFFLFISLGWPSRQGGGPPPPEKFIQGNFPLSLSLKFYAYGPQI